MKSILWVFVALVWFCAPLAAQDPPLPIRRLPDGKPDLSGVYAGPNFANKSTKGVPPPINDPLLVPMADPKYYKDLFRPGGEKLFYHPRTGDLRYDDPPSLCLPLGFPRTAVAAPYSQQIAQPPGYVVIFYEYQRFYHIAFYSSRRVPHQLPDDL